MKSTLIFLSFFLLCFAKVSAKIDTIYTEENGLVKMTIQQIPDVEPKVLKEQTFQNNTEFQYTTEEVTQLLSGGVVVKNTHKMTQLFPPMFSEIVHDFSIQNGNVERVGFKESLPVMSWYYLIFCMILPFGLLLLFSILIPKEKSGYVLIVYILAVAAVAAVAADTGVGAAVIAAVIAAGAFFAKDFMVQYIAFIVLSCIISFILRQWHFKRKERKQLIQATV